MAMLAEPRTKQKWCLNPRGSLWSQDDTKLGQRLLEKMGWSKGKGLGKKEDGNPEHVKVSHKNDSKGMGFKGYDDAWVSHQDDFNALLTSLHKTSGDFHESTKTVELKSLEEKSLKSRKRVHYHKFIRGKDLSKRSAKDLQCIFGKREPSGDATPVAEVDSPHNMDEGNKSSGDNTSSMHTVDSRSVQQYFAEKLAKLKSRHAVDTVQENLITAEENTSALTLKTIKRKKRPSLDTSIEVNNCVNGHVAHTDLPKKKKKQGQVAISYDILEEEINDSTVDLPELSSSREKRRKTKSKNYKCPKEKSLELDQIRLDEKLVKKKRKLEHQNEFDNCFLDSKVDSNKLRSKSKIKSTVVSIFENRSKKIKRHKIDEGLEESAKNFTQRKQKIETGEETNGLSERYIGGKSKRVKESASDKTIRKAKCSKNEYAAPDSFVDVPSGCAKVTEIGLCNTTSNDVSWKTCGKESISQDEVTDMRNAALKVLRTSKQHGDGKLARNNSKDALKDDTYGQVSGYGPLKLKDSVNDDSIQTNMVNTYPIVPDNLCLCKSGYGAFNRLPWEVLNSIGYYRKMVRPDNLALVEDMRINCAFKNSNIFEIKGYEVLPSFKCCCS